MTLEELCRTLAQSNETQARKAAVIILWHDLHSPNDPVKIEELVGVFAAHFLGTPAPASLLSRIKALRVTSGTDRGLHVLAGSRRRVAGWFDMKMGDLEPVAPESRGAIVGPASSGVAPKSAQSKDRNVPAGQLPALFIGSSVEGLKVANALHSNLEFDCEPTVWDKGVFGPNRAPLQTLLEWTARADYAIIVLTPDDMTVKRGEAAPTARDNALFELGLFMGALGPDRTFFTIQRDAGLRLPSDLVGLTTLKYSSRGDENIQAALTSACEVVRQAMSKLGCRRRP